MKKFVFIFVILFLSLSFISAAEIEVNGKILKGETLVAKISGNFVQPLTGENIYFYRRHMPTSMGFYDLIKIQECRPLSKIIHFVVIDKLNAGENKK